MHAKGTMVFMEKSNTYTDEIHDLMKPHGFPFYSPSTIPYSFPPVDRYPHPKTENKVFQRFLKRKEYFKKLTNENGRRLIADKVIDEAERIVHMLSHLFPDASDKEVYFEPDDDGTVLISVEMEGIDILINVFPDSIQYSIETAHDLYVHQIPLNNRDKMLEDINQWFTQTTAQKSPSWMDRMSPASLD